MAHRWVAGAKGFAVGVLALCLSVAGALAYVNSRSNSCAGIGLASECGSGRTELAILLSVLFALMVVLGPLLAWGFLLPLPGGYVIPPILTAVVDIPLLYADLPRPLLLVAPLVAYPVTAALLADPWIRTDCGRATRRGRSARRGSPGALRPGDG